ncbi:MAG: ABC transporter ATP-binding protein [Candidatus Heimdallarchaeota archaeon]|nr:ABC transporter ATP-binding protein [Candidatus Heimdallarchaeota archaeon]
MKIELRNIRMSYQKQMLLEDLNVIFNKGELSCLLGSSGSGKTTILKIIAGVSDAYSGDILFNNEPVKKLAVGSRQVGWVPQQQLLFPGMTVYDNIAYGLVARKVAKQEIEHKVEKIAQLVGVHHLLTRSPDRLSGGERQRVAIARAIAPEPQILLLDEPFSSLDAPERDRLALTLREVQMVTGITTIHVTHSPREADLLADTVFILSEGRIVQHGVFDTVFNNPRTITVASIVGLTNVFSKWDTFTNVIIPHDALNIRKDGRYTGTVIACTKEIMYLKCEENNIEIRNNGSAHPGEVLSFDIDVEMIKFLK